MRRIYHAPQLKVAAAVDASERVTVGTERHREDSNRSAGVPYVRATG